ncbi:hypothetical protein pmac_cds_87 [Pandoravirus macleodensis]|uniref:Uncharacterized protein n=1 Tax=Pandoravirus macleodensis TaxID=2107707 RepID=A0A2U7UEJ9_9VIRU|nr:hypothetical protein pmac_cds_87 [Pandoravirus macleodensis]AVK76775.1 hypothetical protein pmac_cds_87 [Pandoravirus macleodensis]
MDDALQAILLCDMAQEDRKEPAGRVFDRERTAPKDSVTRESAFWCAKRPHEPTPEEIDAQMQFLEEYNATLASDIPDETKHAS